MKTMLKEFLCRHMRWLSRLVIKREFRVHLRIWGEEDYMDVWARNRWSALRQAKKANPGLNVYGLEDLLDDNTKISGCDLTDKAQH